LGPKIILKIFHRVFKVISSECVVINDKEVFVVHRPNHKGLIGFVCLLFLSK